MEELIFFAVIIFFSIIESIARSRKQKRGGGADGPVPELPDPAEWEDRSREYESSGERVPTYDDDLSYDDRARGDTGTRPQPEATPRPTPQPSTSRSSSEVLLPGDLLAELERLAGRAQERKPKRPVEVPKQSPPLPVPAPPRRRPLPSQAARKLPVEHTIHQAHAGYGTDPSSRARSAHDTMDPMAEKLGADAEAVHNQLRSGNPSQLRRAIILRDVLGPPVTLRK